MHVLHQRTHEALQIALGTVPIRSEQMTEKKKSRGHDYTDRAVQEEILIRQRQDMWTPEQIASLSGHFPGNPIVPGVVILGEILESIGQSLGEQLVIIHVPVVKFHSPLRPNEILDLTFELLPEQHLTFSSQVGSRRIASGQFIFQVNNQASLLSL